MSKVRILTHEEVAALLAIVRRYFRDNNDQEVLVNRTPVVDGYCACVDDFLVVVVKYALQEQYLVQVWAEEAAVLVAETECYVNWSAAGLLHKFMKTVWVDPATEDYYQGWIDNLPRELEDWLDSGRRILAEEAADSRKPRA